MVDVVAPGTWACPDGRLVLAADAPRDVWLEQRRRGVGGSDASTVVGVNPYSSRYELWLDKTGQLEEEQPTMAMRMGNLLEPVVAQLFSEETGIGLRRAGLMESRTRPWQRVTVDRLTDDGGLLECKTTNWRLADEWDNGQVADHAEVQTQHALAVTGRSHAWACVLIDGRDFRFSRVERDEALIETITAMEAQFWTENVLANVAPGMEPTSLSAVKRLYEKADLESRVAEDSAVVDAIIARRASAKAAEKEAAQEAKKCEAELLAIIAGAELLEATDGRILATWKKTNRAGYTVDACTYRRLNIPKPKKR